MGIADDATTVLLRLAAMQQALRDTRDEYVDGPTLDGSMQLGPDRMNDAVSPMTTPRSHERLTAASLERVHHSGAIAVVQTSEDPEVRVGLKIDQDLTPLDQSVIRDVDNNVVHSRTSQHF